MEVGIMCGRYTLTLDDRLLRELFGISPEAAGDFEYSPNYNICPGSQVPVIYSENGAGVSMRLMRWGLIPRWAKAPSIGYKMINARAETVHQKPAYKVPFARQRCLVPADGFYEWQKDNGGKIPYRITLPEETPFTFAGLWDRWISPEGERILSFSIVTVEAGEGVREIHNRMPVILADNSSRDAWLDMGTPVGELKELLTSYTGELVSYRVSTLVNSPRNNSPQLIERIP
jgi:putative SOS response-associated peptidase YedK